MTTRDRFVRETIEWLERRVLADGETVEPDTPLFDSGLIGSLQVLQLIAWTERAIGSHIPDRQIRMDNFRSVRRIAEVFLEEVTHVDG